MGMKAVLEHVERRAFGGGFERTPSNNGKPIRPRVQILTAMRRTNVTEFPIEFLVCSTARWPVLQRVLKPSLVTVLCQASLPSFPEN